MSKDVSKSKQGANESRTVSGELFTLTYGALILDLIKDFGTASEVNRQLEKIGYNIGMRLADDFLSKNPRINRCSDMQQVAEIIAKQALKNYLGITAQTNVLDRGSDFSLVLESNPLTEFVELPQEWSELRYSQVVCGVIRGALEAMHMEVEVVLASDIPNQTEINIKFLRHLKESMPLDDED